MKAHRDKDFTKVQEVLTQVHQAQSDLILMPISPMEHIQDLQLLNIIRMDHGKRVQQYLTQLLSLTESSDFLEPPQQVAFGAY